MKASRSKLALGAFLSLSLLQVAVSADSFSPSLPDLPALDPAEPFAFFLQWHPNVHRNEHAIWIHPEVSVIAPDPTLARGQDDRVMLVLPITIRNLSSRRISAVLNHEWHGGIWSWSDLGIAVRRSDGPPDSWDSVQAYLAGERDEATPQTVWEPKESHRFLLRLNWPGTGSRPTWPLIDEDKPGKYMVKLALVFTVGSVRPDWAHDALSYRQRELFESPLFEIELRDFKH